MSDLQNYLFIDGNYLRRRYEETMSSYFETPIEFSSMDLAKLLKAVNASKAFFYDAVAEDGHGAETRRAQLNAIARIGGFHVREGWVKTKDERKQPDGRVEPRRQKGVDVQLTVECLSHAFRKNIWHASIVAGDLDFQPLVRELVNLGTHVHLYYSPLSIDDTLRMAADQTVAVTVSHFWPWSTRAFLNNNPAPRVRRVLTRGVNVNAIHLAAGIYVDGKVRRLRPQGGRARLLVLPDYGKPFTVEHSDETALMKYFGHVYGAITWD